MHPKSAEGAPGKVVVLESDYKATRHGHWAVPAVPECCYGYAYCVVY
jgi:hypothetical protein